MATFVLVHGAWHGGWCYARVARLLRAAGHDVYTPTLTGLGERAHLGAAGVTLALHVHDIVNVLRYEDLSDVILCGHSYGGMVIAGVASAAGERVRTLFFLDAFVPQTGESVIDMNDPERVAWYLAQAKRGGGMLPPIPSQHFKINAADAAWVDRTCVPQPLTTFVEGVDASGIDAVANRTYVFATGYGSRIFGGFYERLRTDARWKARTVASGHDVMLDRPDDLAQLLLEEVDR